MLKTIDNTLERLEKTLAELLAETRPAALFEAMRHAVLGGGKRIRPQLCLAAAAVVGGRAEDARRSTAATRASSSSGDFALSI